MTETKKETPYTWGDLKEFVNSLNEDQLKQVVIWWGDERGGKIDDANVLDEDYFQGEYCAYPKSEHVHYQEDEDCPPADEMPIAQLKGTPMLWGDLSS